MVRPIRVPQAEVGLGGPAALPSIAAQTAPARAAAQLGQAAAGLVGEAVQKHVDKKNNLSFVRQGAEASAAIKSGVAGATETLRDYVNSEDYSEEGYVRFYA